MRSDGCICAFVPHLHTSNYTSFLFFVFLHKLKSDSTAFSGNDNPLRGVTACVLLPVYYGTLGHVMRTVSQRGRQWFRPSGLA